MLTWRKVGVGEVGRMSVRISYTTPTYYPAYALLQNRTIVQIIDALRVAAFSRAGDISVLLVCSSICAGHATGRGSFIMSVSAITEEARRYSHLLARSMRYTLPTHSWMFSMNGLQDQGAIVIRTRSSWSTIHLWKVSVPNVSGIFLYVCFWLWSF